MSTIPSNPTSTVEDTKQLFIIDKSVLQIFLDYLAKRPYSEVFEIIEAMKTAKLVSAVVSDQTVQPGMASAQTEGVQQSLNPNS